jgi:hypothetical protein
VTAPKTCTWKDCSRIAAHPKVSGDGEQWANLCTGHHDELLRSLDRWKLIREVVVLSGPLRRAWIFAVGGSVAAIRRMLG